MMRIRWTEPAAHDLTAICDFIEEHLRPGSSQAHTPGASRRLSPQRSRYGDFMRIRFFNSLKNACSS